MGISEYDIKYCLQHKSFKVNNPLRMDKHPSLGFMLYKNNEGFNVIHCRDFGEPYYSGDCFKIAGKRLKLNSDKGSHFNKILNHILVYVILKNEDKSLLKLDLSELPPSIIQHDYRVKSLFSFSYLVPTRNFLSYWRSLLFYDVKTMLNENYIYEPANVIIDDTLVHTYSSNNRNLAILYYLGNYEGNGLYKLYKPYGGKYDKFRTNNRFLIEALHELKGNTNLILSKSRKDCVILRSLIKHLGIKNIDVISVTSESLVFRDDFSFNYINSKYENIFTLFDYDNIGTSYMFYNYIVYNIIPIWLTSNKELDSERCKFILEFIYNEVGLEYSIDEMFTILSKYQNHIDIVDYKGKDVAELVYYNRDYSLHFLTNILNNISNEESSVE